MHLKFEGVKGYASYANAQKRGEEIEAKNRDTQFRWVVIALPSGRFAPLIIANEKAGPHLMLGEVNVCIAN